MRDEGPYAEQEQWKREVQTYWKKFRRHWLWWVSTSLGGVIALWRGVGGVIPGWVILLISIFGVIVAGFLTWREEHRLVVQRALEIASLKMQADLARDKALDEVVFETVKHINDGKIPLQALLLAEAERLPSNADVVSVCDTLVKFGNQHPFSDPSAGASGFVSTDQYLSFLVTARMRGVDFKTEQDIIIFISNASYPTKPS